MSCPQTSARNGSLAPPLRWCGEAREFLEPQILWKPRGIDSTTTCFRICNFLTVEPCIKGTFHENFDLIVSHCLCFPCCTTTIYCYVFLDNKALTSVSQYFWQCSEREAMTIGNQLVVGTCMQPKSIPTVIKKKCSRMPDAAARNEVHFLPTRLMPVFK